MEHYEIPRTLDDSALSKFGTKITDDMPYKDVTLNAPYTSCIIKIINILIDNAEGFDIVMPMYNLLEYIGNYSMTSGSLWNYDRHKVDDDDDDDDYSEGKVI